MVGMTGPNQPKLVVAEGAAVRLTGIGRAFQHPESSAPSVVRVVGYTNTADGFADALLPAVGPGSAVISVATGLCLLPREAAHCPVLAIHVSRG
jgi:hypothetical protein